MDEFLCAQRATRMRALPDWVLGGWRTLVPTAGASAWRKVHLL